MPILQTNNQNEETLKRSKRLPLLLPYFFTALILKHVSLFCLIPILAIKVLIIDKFLSHVTCSWRQGVSVWGRAREGRIFIF